jgi:Fe-Mn family superoxide dismutase
MKKIKDLPEYSLVGLYDLPKLNYEYNSFEPFIDSITMEIHHKKHHKAYVDNLNKALMESKDNEKPLLEIFANISDFSPAVRNNGGGHYNHSFFWKILNSNVSEKNHPFGNVKRKIEEEFGSIESFYQMFINVSVSRFGSGWAWLSLDDNGRLFVSSTPNQDNPLMNIADKNGYPVLGIDLWEHAYYLNYQNRRLDYINSFFKIINWDEVENRLVKLL